MSAYTTHKLGDLRLTDLQVRGLLRLIDAQITDAEKAQAKENERIADDLFDTRYAATQEAAKQTARQDGPTSIPAHLQAQAAWQAFIVCEGWLLPYDSDLFDRYYYNALDVSTTDHAEFVVGWESAYVMELETMKAEAKEKAKAAK